MFTVNSKGDRDTSRYANHFLANYKDTRTSAKDIVLMPLLLNLNGFLLGR